VPVEDSSALKHAGADIEAKQGRLDVPGSTARASPAMWPHNDLDALDDRLIDDIFRVNWRGPFAAIRPPQNAGGPARAVCDQHS